MNKKYENLVNEYANVRCTIEYIRVLKHFGADVYKSNKEEIENQLDRLNKESDKLLDGLGELGV